MSPILTSRSSPHLNWTVTTEILSIERERILSTPSIIVISSSMVLDTLCSTSLADAPGHVVRIFTTGGSIFGSMSSSSVVNTIPPSRITTRKTISIMVLRFTENSGRFISPPPSL